MFKFIFCGLIKLQKLETQNIIWNLSGSKPQKFWVAENTCYTVIFKIIWNLGFIFCFTEQEIKLLSCFQNSFACILWCLKCLKNVSIVSGWSQPVAIRSSPAEDPTPGTQGLSSHNAAEISRTTTIIMWVEDFLCQ